MQHGLVLMSEQDN